MSDAVERRLERERRARREAESIAERVTSELYATVTELARAKAVLDETTDFVAITDPAGHPSYLNRMLTETFGLHVGDGRSVFDLLTPASRGRLDDDILGVLEEKGIVRDEFAFVRDTGREVPVSAVLIAHRSSRGAVDSLSIIGRDITEQRAMEDELAHRALHDPLTTLPNRRLFFECLDLAVARASRAASSCAVMFIDLDGFKAVNDSLGHAAGDMLLFTVAGRLNACVRAADVVARFGGDEFAALCENVTRAHAEEIADRLLRRAAEPVHTDAGDATVTASIGIAFSARGEASPEVMVRDADKAMYDAKRGGKSRYVVVTAGTI